MATSNTENVFQKIAEVMKDISYIQKDDNVETGKGKSYRAVTEEKVTSAVRASLVKHGLVILPIEQVTNTEQEQVQDKYGNVRVNHFVEVATKYRIQNIEDETDYIEVVSSGSGVDTQDKGVGKAMTYAYKYMLLRTFAIPTGEDPDRVSSDLYSEENMPIVPITRVQANTLVGIAKNKGKDSDWLLEHAGVARLGEINTKQYAEITKELENL